MLLDLAPLLDSGVIDQAAFDAHSEFAEVERERAARNQRLLEKIKRDAPRPVGFAALIEQRRVRGRRPLTSKVFEKLERRWHQRRRGEMKNAIEAIADKQYGDDEGGCHPQYCSDCICSPWHFKNRIASGS
jgi:hypothetical protein